MSNIDSTDLLEKILEAKELVEKFPVGMVMSTQKYIKLEEYSRKYIIDPEIENSKTLYNTPIFHFDDVDDTILFCDQGKLSIYLEQREEGDDHLQSLLKCMESDIKNIF